MYFFAGQVFVNGFFQKFVNGTIEGNILNRDDSRKLLENINDLVIEQIKKEYPLKKINYQITNISIIGEVVTNDKGKH
jgi:hypothetical protein